MKKNLLLYSIVWIVLLIGCGPELQTVINRDAHNRVILEAEVKGEVDTLWSKVYTYHFAGDPALAVNTDPEPQETPEEETPEEETPQEETPEEPKVYIVTADTTKKSFLAMQKGEQRASGKPGGRTALLNQSSLMLKMRLRAYIPILTAWVPKLRLRPIKRAY